MKEQQRTKFYKNFFHIISENFQMEDTEGNAKDIDEKLYAQLTEQKDIRQFIAKFDEAIQLTCRKTCQFLGGRTLSK